MSEASSRSTCFSLSGAAVPTATAFNFLNIFQFSFNCLRRRSIFAWKILIWGAVRVRRRGSSIKFENGLRCARYVLCKASGTFQFRTTGNAGGIASPRSQHITSCITNPRKWLPYLWPEDNWACRQGLRPGFEKWRASLGSLSLLLFPGRLMISYNVNIWLGPGVREGDIPTQPPQYFLFLR